MDEPTLRKLQFSDVREVLRKLCSCELGQQHARLLKPSGHVEQVRLWLEQVKEIRDTAAHRGLPPLGGLRDIRREVEDTGKPAGIDGEAMSRIQSTLVAVELLRHWMADLPENAVHMTAMLHQIHDFRDLIGAIDQTVDARGHVRDQASDKLAGLRATIADLNHKIRGVFDRVLKQRRYQKMLQYTGVTFHDDRYVLPLKIEYRGRIPGIVHRSSKSGATVFIEPSDAVEMNNAIIRLRLKEDAEVARLLRELGRTVHRRAPEIMHTLEVVSALDLMTAKVRYAKKYRATCAEISSDRRLALHSARHPVLLDTLASAAPERSAFESVVPIDVRLGDDFDVLVITGPNTGGKTVAIKTIGLLAAMNQAGIPVPAEAGTTMPVYEDIFIDVGDEQSIEQSLSTFSGHLSNILDILGKAGRDSLVLLDELGAGTDPDEGAALGRAIMDELLSLGCSATVTTHLSLLKSAAYTCDRVDNASVEFDVETLKPTYRLQIGEPGNSNAFTIAKRLGMSRQLVKRARRHIRERDRILNQAVEGTLRSRRRAEQARAQAQLEKQAAERQQLEMQQRAEELQRAKTRFHAWQKWLTTLKPGDRVYVKRLGRNATVVRMQLHRQQAVICRGAVDFEMPLTELDHPVGQDGGGEGR